MEVKSPPYGPLELAGRIGDLHHYAPVELALRRAVPVNGAAEVFPICLLLHI